MKKLEASLLSLLFVLTACDGETSGTPARPPDRSESASREPRSVPPACPNQNEVAADDGRQIGGELTGDVDGDDQADRVRLTLDAEAEVGCQAFLAVDLGASSVVAPIWETGPQGGLPQPRLHSLVQVDSEGGLEILVDEVAGASTQFVAVYIYDDGSIEKIEPRGVPDGLFAYGGSVGHIEATGCASGGDIVVSQALPGETRRSLNRSLYDVTRRYFTRVGEAYTRERVERQRDVPLKNLDRFDEFGSGPFGNCPSR
jgi:hypothetical protein